MYSGVQDTETKRKRGTVIVQRAGGGWCSVLHCTLYSRGYYNLLYCTAVGQSTKGERISSCSVQKNVLHCTRRRRVFRTALYRKYYCSTHYRSETPSYSGRWTSVQLPVQVQVEQICVFYVCLCVFLCNVYFGLYKLSQLPSKITQR